MSIELSRPGEAGLRGCSGWVAHAAGQGTWDKLPRTFSVEKTLGALYRMGKPPRKKILETGQKSGQKPYCYFLPILQ